MNLNLNMKYTYKLVYIIILYDYKMNLSTFKGFLKQIKQSEYKTRMHEARREICVLLKWLNGKTKAEVGERKIP